MQPPCDKSFNEHLPKSSFVPAWSLEIGDRLQVCPRLKLEIGDRLQVRPRLKPVPGTARSKPTNNNELPAISGKRYFTIGGAKQQLFSVEAKDDISQYKQLIRQMIRELEDVLAVM